MTETRVMIGHAQHKAQGPHLDAPADFVPLRLCVEGAHMQIDVTCCVAIVGRHTDADLRFAYPEVSRQHCRLTFENGQWRVYDLNSTNGTYLNNAPIAEATLYAGDLLHVGGVKILVEVGTPMRASKVEKLRQIVEALPDVNS